MLLHYIALIGSSHIGYHPGYGHNQWETTLQCNIVSHWLCPYPEWSLHLLHNAWFMQHPCGLLYLMFSTILWIWWKFCFALIEMLILWSPQKFARNMTAVLWNHKHANFQSNLKLGSQYVSKKDLKVGVGLPSRLLHSPILDVVGLSMGMRLGLWLTHWPLGDLDVILKMEFSILFYWLVTSDLLMIMASDECHRTLLMISFNIGSGNGLVLSGNKPLPEPMLILFLVTLLRR